VRCWVESAKSGYSGVVDKYIGDAIGSGTGSIPMTAVKVLGLLGEEIRVR
jgi:hypothetical protein